VIEEQSEMSDGANFNSEYNPASGTELNKPESKTKKVSQRMFLDDLEYTA
jgi:hypothetical protein